MLEFKVKSLTQLIREYSDEQAVMQKMMHTFNINLI